jgi:hypothetical protein
VKSNGQLIINYGFLNGAETAPAAAERLKNLIETTTSLPAPKDLHKWQSHAIADWKSEFSALCKVLEKFVLDSRNQ